MPKHDGKFRMVRMNIDNCKDLAQGLKVRRVPSLYLIYKGSVLDQQIGFKNTQTLDELIQTALLVD